MFSITICPLYALFYFTLTSPPHKITTLLSGGNGFNVTNLILEFHTALNSSAWDHCGLPLKFPFPIPYGLELGN